MSRTLPAKPDPVPNVDPVRLVEALDALVAAGTITAAQRTAILAAVAGSPLPGAAAAPAPRRRSLTDVLIEVGLYVGSALVLAAAVALVAQTWEDLSRTTQILLLLGIAVATGSIGMILARGAAAGSARRRLAGVLLTGAAASAAGGVGLAAGDSDLSGVLAMATAVAVLVLARVLAASAITEIGLFVATFVLLSVTGEWLRPEEVPVLDEFGSEVYEPSTYDRLLSVGSVAFGLVWALLVARWMMHRELAVALGAGVAFVSAMPLAGEQATRPWGLAALAVLAVLGFWRFMVEGLWPWLLAAIASVTGFVFWAVGVDRNPALAFLVGGLVLLASSGLGWQVARRRRRVVTNDERPAAPTLAPTSGGDG